MPLRDQVASGPLQRLSMFRFPMLCHGFGLRTSVGADS